MSIFDIDLKLYSMKLLVLATTLFLTLSALSQSGTTCIESQPFCIGTTYTSAIGGTAAAGNDYGCLASQPNPTWYFLKSSIGGAIELSLTAPNDIDFIIYGPFNDYDDILNSCGSLGDVNSPIIDCSYSGTNMETPSIPNSISGEYYLMVVTNYANLIQEISLVQTAGIGSLDCSVYDEAGYQFISGAVYYDQNQNGIQDTLELTIPNVEFTVSPSNYTGYSDQNGDIGYFQQTLDTIQYEINSTFPNWNLTSIPTQYQFTLDTTNSTFDSVYFGYYPQTIYQDATIDIFCSNTQCLSNTLFWVDIQNTGTDLVNLQFELILPIQLQLDNSTYPYDSIIGNSIFYSYDSLNLFEDFNFPIYISPTGTDTLTVSDTLVYTASLNIYDSNNALVSTVFDTLSSTVICSYDPNQKTAFPNGNTQSSIIQPTDYIEYLIDFQNTGNAFAVDVVIEDSISQNIDLSTFEFISSSHNVAVSIDNTNRLLKFNFENIMLPDSNNNEILSHGYVKYYAETIDNLLPHEEVENTAFIYFDLNSPIITNTTQNTIDCYIIPENANFSMANNEIHSNLSDPNYTYMWIFNNDTLVNETNNFIPNQGNGDYVLIVSNQYQCENNSTYNLSLSINEFDDNSILIYPTPSSSEFTIKSVNQMISSLIIFDTNGRKYKEINDLNTFEYTLTGDLLQSGVYYIEVTVGENKVITKKIIKL